MVAYLYQALLCIIHSVLQISRIPIGITPYIRFFCNTQFQLSIGLFSIS